MTKAMSIYCGKTAKIVEIANNDYYYLDIDNKSRTWSSWMFEERLEDIFKTSIKDYCSNVCIFDCDKNCPLFKFKELL